MTAVLVALLSSLRAGVRSRVALQLEVLALRHQLAVYQRGRRRVVHFNITEHPTAHWTAQQISEAFPWETAPRFLVRDHSWQNAFAERIIGSIRRECLENVVVLDDRHLRRLLTDYFDHYHRWRCHRSLDMDCPLRRPVQDPQLGEVVEVAEPGGLYHHYERRAA
jgi:transposase InsO family protein